MKGKRLLSLMAAFVLALAACLAVPYTAEPEYADAGDGTGTLPCRH